MNKIRADVERYLFPSKMPIDELDIARLVGRAMLMLGLVVALAWPHHTGPWWRVVIGVGVRGVLAVLFLGALDIMASKQGERNGIWHVTQQYRARPTEPATVPVAEDTPAETLPGRPQLAAIHEIVENAGPAGLSPGALRKALDRRGHTMTDKQFANRMWELSELMQLVKYDTEDQVFRPLPARTADDDQEWPGLSSVLTDMIVRSGERGVTADAMLNVIFSRQVPILAADISAGLAVVMHNDQAVYDTQTHRYHPLAAKGMTSQNRTQST